MFGTAYLCMYTYEGQRQDPDTNPQSRRSLFPRVPHPEKHHMLSPANDRSTRRRLERFRARVIAGETKATNRRRIRAADRHLCVHTVGSFGLLVLGHSFHVPQPKSARMRTGKTGAFVSMNAAASWKSTTVRVRTGLL